MTVFSFPYLEERTRKGVTIFRPYVAVELQGADGSWHLFRLYADAAADLTLLTAADCEVLGYPLEAGEPQLMGGVCSGLIQTFVHELLLRLGTEVFPCPVAFADRADVPPLLGRSGVFQRFQVCYDDVKRVTRFILRASGGQL